MNQNGSKQKKKSISILIVCFMFFSIFSPAAILASDAGAEGVVDVSQDVFMTEDYSGDEAIREEGELEEYAPYGAYVVIMPIGYSVTVGIWEDLRTEINNAAGGAVEIVVTANLSATGGAIVIPADTYVILLADGNWNITNDNASDSSAFIVEGTLNLGAENPGGGLTISGFTLGAITVLDGGTFNMYAGTISDNISVPAHDGGGVFVTGGTFNMHGGEISGNDVDFGSGGGVFVKNDSTFNMYGGEISGNGAQSGSGVSLTNSSTMTMSGGYITSNTAINNSGGVIVSNNSTFEMSGGYITDNTTTGQSGGVGVSGGTFEMSGGEISGNTANDSGGGVTLTGGNSTFTMSGDALISGNTVNNVGGGGVVVSTGATFTINTTGIGGGIIGNTSNGVWGGGGVWIIDGTMIMEQGVIADNTASNAGGGVHVSIDSTLTMTGGTITENIATLGGGVEMSSGQFNLQGGTISNNTATTGNGGGINHRGGSIFTNSINDAVTITGNTAGGNGGGIYMGSNAIAAGNTLHVTDDVIISNNTAANNGGGVFMNHTNTRLNMTGGIISGNTATIGNGGGVLVVFGGTEVSVTGGKVINNIAQLDGGGMWIPIPSRPLPTLQVDTSVIFEGNIALRGIFDYGLVDGLADFPNIQWSGVNSAPGTHLLNNFDINNYTPGTAPLWPVTFDLNGGNVGGNIENIVYLYEEGELIGLPGVPKPIRPGFTFIGWQLDGEGTIYTAEEVADHAVYGPLTFVAVWIPKPPTITKEASWERSGSPMAGDTITYIITITNPNETVTLDVYDFVVVDQLDSRITFVPNSVTQAVYNSDGSWQTVVADVYYYNGELRITLKNELPAGAYIVITFDVTIASNTAGQTINNTAILKDADGYEVDRDEAGVTIRAGGNGGGGGRPGGGEGPGADDGDEVTRPDRPELDVFTTDHISYLVGFPDGTIRPNSTITRAEVATIFFRLLDDNYRIQVWSQNNPFSDVVLTNWFNNAVSTLANAEIVEGFPDGIFRGTQAITRAEFVTMVARFLDDTNYTGADRFNDISGHWAREYINVIGQYDWIRGFAGGDFRPNQNITRAEAAAIVNRMLNRQPESVEDLLPGMVTWPDNMNENAWFYLYIQEATNSHDFEMKADGVHERWTELWEPRDWTVLERPNSRPQDIL